MLHEMKLFPKPFAAVKSGRKTVELRLCDEKRQMIAAGDTIRFTNTADGETLEAEVIALHRFGSFRALYAALPLDKCGYSPEELSAAASEDMNAYYSPEQQAQYGALGIEIKVFSR